MLTKGEHNVLSAIDNETDGMSATDRDQRFLHYVRAWDNAAVYADQYGMSVERFRRILTKLTGYYREQS